MGSLGTGLQLSPRALAGFSMSIDTIAQNALMMHWSLASLTRLKHVFPRLLTFKMNDGDMLLTIENRCVVSGYRVAIKPITPVWGGL